MSLFEDLSAATENEHGKWTNSARLYASLSRSFQAIIIASGSAALGAKAIESIWGRCERWVPILAVVAGAFTAMESWLRPTQKWKGFLSDRDELDRIRIL